MRRIRNRPDQGDWASPTNYLFEVIPGVRLKILISSVEILVISVCEGERNGDHFVSFCHSLINKKQPQPLDWSQPNHARKHFPHQKLSPTATRFSAFVFQYDFARQKYVN